MNALLTRPRRDDASPMLATRQDKQNPLRSRSSVRKAAIVFSFFGVVLGLGLACAQDDDGDAGTILECSGNCSCDVESNTCQCSGGTTCEVEGGDGVTIQCQGNARCDLTCTEPCNVECQGTSGCDAALVDGSTASCSGSGDCAFTCEGSCVVSCTGSATCSLACPQDGDCMIDGCQGVVTCPDGTLACGVQCPA